MEDKNAVVVAPTTSNIGEGQGDDEDLYCEDGVKMGYIRNQKNAKADTFGILDQ